MVLNEHPTSVSLTPGPTTVQAQGHTTPDGMLHLSIPIGIADADVAVVLQVSAIHAPTDMDENGWPRGYFDQVPGSMPELQRAPQGDFERRSQLA